MGNCGYRAKGITSVETRLEPSCQIYVCVYVMGGSVEEVGEVAVAISLLGALAAKICEINRVEIVQNGFSNSKSRRRGKPRRHEQSERERAGNDKG